MAASAPSEGINSVILQTLCTDCQLVPVDQTVRSKLADSHNGSEATKVYWFHLAVPGRGTKTLPAWIRVADCWRARRLRRWYRSQQHWMEKAHWDRIFFLWSSSKSSCKTTARQVSTPKKQTRALIFFTGLISNNPTRTIWLKKKSSWHYVVT